MNIINTLDKSKLKQNELIKKLRDERFDKLFQESKMTNQSRQIRERKQPFSFDQESFSDISLKTHFLNEILMSDPNFSINNGFNKSANSNDHEVILFYSNQLYQIQNQQYTINIKEFMNFNHQEAILTLIQQTSLSNKYTQCFNTLMSSLDFRQKLLTEQIIFGELLRKNRYRHSTCLFKNLQSMILSIFNSQYSSINNILEDNQFSLMINAICNNLIVENQINEEEQVTKQYLFLNNELLLNLIISQREGIKQKVIPIDVVYKLNSVLLDNQLYSNQYSENQRQYLVSINLRIVSQLFLRGIPDQDLSKNNNLLDCINNIINPKFGKYNIKINEIEHINYAINSLFEELMLLFNHYSSYSPHIFTNNNQNLLHFVNDSFGKFQDQQDGSSLIKDKYFLNLSTCLTRLMNSVEITGRTKDTLMNDLFNKLYNKFDIIKNYVPEFIYLQLDFLLEFVEEEGNNQVFLVFKKSNLLMQYITFIIDQYRYEDARLNECILKLIMKCLDDNTQLKNLEVDPQYLQNQLSFALNLFSNNFTDQPKMNYVLVILLRILELEVDKVNLVHKLSESKLLEKLEILINKGNQVEEIEPIFEAIKEVELN